MQVQVAISEFEQTVAPTSTNSTSLTSFVRFQEGEKKRE